MSNPLATVTDWFLLREAERRAAEVPSERLERIRELSSAGMRRLNAATDLRETAPEIGLSLLAQASPLLIAAFAETRGHGIDIGAGVGASWEAFEKLTSTATLKNLPADASSVAATLSTTDPLAFDSLTREDALSKFSSAESLLTWLYQQVDARSPKDIRRARIVRLVVSGAAVIAFAFWGISSLLSAPNIALRKPTTAVSYWPGSANDGLTNGVNESGYAVATGLESEPWIRLDLESVYRISSIVVVPRGDNHAEELVPAVVEISENGTDYTEVGRRSDTYSQMFPWKVSGGGKKGRYVRVRALKHTVLALAEIEVRGRH